MVPLRWFSVVVLGISIILGWVGESRAQMKHEILDRLPAEDAIYLWTNDSQRLFKEMAGTFPVSREQLISALEVPERWTRDREAFELQDADTSDKGGVRGLLQELVECWEWPLFEGEAAWMRSRVDGRSVDLLILEAPAPLEKYEKLIQGLNQLLYPLPQTKEQFGLQDRKTGNDGTPVYQAGMLGGYWAHNGEYFFWSKKQEWLERVLDFVELGADDRSGSLTDDRVFETVFRSIPIESRRSALLHLYVPPQGVHTIARHGYRNQKLNFGQVYSPLWLDVLQDVRGIGATIRRPDEDRDGSVSAKWVADSFVLVNHPRGPITSSLATLENDWIPNVLPRRLGILLSGGINGEELLSTFATMDDRFARRPEDLRTRESAMLRVEDRMVEHQFPTPKPKDLESLANLASKAKLFTFIAGEPKPQDYLHIQHSFDPLLYLRMPTAEDAVRGLSEFIASDERATLSMSQKRDGLSWEKVASKDDQVSIWDVPADAEAAMTASLQSWLDSAFAPYYKRLEEARQKGPEEVARVEQEFAATMDFVRRDRGRFFRAFKSIWLQAGEWALPVPVDPELIDRLEDRSEDWESEQQVARLEQDLEWMEAQWPGPRCGILAVWAKHIALQTIALDGTDPEQKPYQVFRPQTKFEEREDSMIGMGVLRQRRGQLELELLRAFDRMVFTFHDETKGIRIQGAILSEEENAENLKDSPNE